MTASSKPLEPNKMRRQGSRDVRLTLNRRHRIYFPAHHQSWALHTRELGEHVERVGFPTWPCEPLQNFRIYNRPMRDVRISGSARVKRKREQQPSVE